MSDSDDDICLPEIFSPFRTKLKEIAIKLDPEATLSQRRRDEEFDFQICQAKELISHGIKEVVGGEPASPSTDSNGEEIEDLVESCRTINTGQIKLVPPKRCTFDVAECCRLYNKDSLIIKNFKTVDDKLSKYLLETNTSELHDYICKGNFKRSFSQDVDINPLCWYLLFLMSVHPDEKFVFVCSDTLEYILEDWCPTLDGILVIFINWGILPDLLKLDEVLLDNIPLNIEDEKLAPSPRFSDYNVQVVLELLYSVAPSLAANSNASKFNNFLRILVLSALDNGFTSPKLKSRFSICIGQLLSCIPDEQWTTARVSDISEALHCAGKEDFYIHMDICCSLLSMSSRAVEVAEVLAFTTLNNLLAKELKKELYIESRDLYQLVKHYGYIHKLSFPVQYALVKLLGFCIERRHVSDTLTLDQIKSMITWLSNLKGLLFSVVEDIDSGIVQELIARCLSSWHIIKTEMTLSSVTDCSVTQAEDM
ncbi:uncharacterized protein [Periplaneta americana]|uniref:uncharacterized protein isoform X3 n=1 Tax=Periplaneta americana TaxID=6978 RepID=UPI0037E8A2E7